MSAFTNRSKNTAVFSNRTNAGASFTYPSKNAAVVSNQSKAPSLETWDQDLNTWDAETRTWDGTVDYIPAYALQSRNAPVFANGTLH